MKLHGKFFLALATLSVATPVLAVSTNDCVPEQKAYYQAVVEEAEPSYKERVYGGDANDAYSIAYLINHTNGLDIPPAALLWRAEHLRRNSSIPINNAVHTFAPARPLLEGCLYEARARELGDDGKSESTEPLASDKAATTTSPVGPVVNKSTLGKCVSLINPERFTKIYNFDTDKGHLETLNDALNLTLKNSCNSDQIIGLIIKYSEDFMPSHGSLIALQRPDKPYISKNEQQSLTLGNRYVQMPFAGTISNPYAYQFVPQQQESLPRWENMLLPANTQSKHLFVPIHGGIKNDYDPRQKTLEYYIASCPAKKDNDFVGLFWDPSKKTLACPSWTYIRVLPCDSVAKKRHEYRC